jgi:hypothetical protein
VEAAANAGARDSVGARRGEGEGDDGGGSGSGASSALPRPAGSGRFVGQSVK